MKKKSKFFLCLIAIVLMGFVGHQIYVYSTTGRSCIFTYRGSVTPEDIGVIFQEVRVHMFGMMMSDDKKEFPDMESLCKAVNEIEPTNDQSLKHFHISLIYNNETGKTYLYSQDVYRIMSEDKYPTSSEVWKIVLLANKSLSEKPKGIYHSFKLSPTGNDWVTLTRDGMGLKINSSIPPIPGCFYNTEEEKVYVPSELLPAYEIVYPNLNIPEASIMKHNINEYRENK